MKKNDMPEGPSLLILREQLQPLFEGKKIKAVTGNAKIDLSRLQGKKIHSIRTWGKQLFIGLPGDLYVRVHFLLFGSSAIDEHIKPERSVRLSLQVTGHQVWFYNCSVKLLEEDIDKVYDWEADVLSEKWNPVKARKKLKEMPKTLACDALLDQQVFSGVGNIIKNEVLFRIKMHPESRLGKLPPRKLSDLIREAHKYSYDFLRWKKEFTLKKHWLAHTKSICPRCEIPFIKKKCGRTNRRSFFCKRCQVKY
jgi:endonuclease-8